MRSVILVNNSQATGSDADTLDTALALDLKISESTAIRKLSAMERGTLHPTVLESGLIHACVLTAT